MSFIKSDKNLMEKLLSIGLKKVGNNSDDIYSPLASMANEMPGQEGTGGYKEKTRVIDTSGLSVSPGIPQTIEPSKPIEKLDVPSANINKSIHDKIIDTYLNPKNINETKMSVNNLAKKLLSSISSDQITTSSGKTLTITIPKDTNDLISYLNKNKIKVKGESPVVTSSEIQEPEKNGYSKFGETDFFIRKDLIKYYLEFLNKKFGTQRGESAAKISNLITDAENVFKQSDPNFSVDKSKTKQEMSDDTYLDAVPDLISLENQSSLWGKGDNELRYGDIANDQSLNRWLSSNKNIRYADANNKELTWSSESGPETANAIKSILLRYLYARAYNLQIRAQDDQSKRKYVAYAGAVQSISQSLGIQVSAQIGTQQPQNGQQQQQQQQQPQQTGYFGSLDKKQIGEMLGEISENLPFESGKIDLTNINEFASVCAKYFSRTPQYKQLYDALASYRKYNSITSQFTDRTYEEIKSRVQQVSGDRVPLYYFDVLEDIVESTVNMMDGISNIIKKENKIVTKFDTNEQSRISSYMNNIISSIQEKVNISTSYRTALASWKSSAQAEFNKLR